MNTTTTQGQVAARIREALHSREKNAQDLADRIMVSKRQAQRLLAGHSKIDFDYLRVIGRWLGVNPRSFLGLPDTGYETWLTVRECAATAKRHPETIRKAIRAGELPSTQRKARGTHFVLESDLNAWIAGVR